MSDNKENLKIKLTPDDLDQKSDTAEKYSENSMVPPVSKSLSQQSINKPTVEPAGIKPLSQTIEKQNVSAASPLPPSQEVKLKVKFQKPDTESEKNTQIQIQKTTESKQPQDQNSHPAITENVSPSLNITDTEKEKTHIITLKKTSVPKPAIINLDEINRKPVNNKEEKNIPVSQEQSATVKVPEKINLSNLEIVPQGNGKPNMSDTIRLQIKPKTVHNSAFSELITEEKQKVPAEEPVKTPVPDSLPSKDTGKGKKVKFKYLYLIGALILLAILLYFLFSTIKTLMAI